MLQLHQWCEYPDGNTTQLNEMSGNSSSAEIRIEFAALRAMCIGFREELSRHTDREHDALNRRIDFVISELNRIDKLVSGWDSSIQTIKWIVGLCMPLATAAVVAFVVRHWQ